MSVFQTVDQPASSPVIDPGSFRDRDGRVFYDGARVFRALSADAKREWEKLRGTRFFQRFLADGAVVPTRDHPGPVAVDGAWAGVVEHERIPFISYPYEWSFGMLKDAALQQLDLLLAALDEDMSLVDCSAYNTQFVGARPVFIDIPSIRTLQPGQPWMGYRQFCELFLYPLMLQAYKDVAFQPYLRGRIDGITPQEMNQLMSLRDLFRRGVFFHVYLHSRMQSRYAATRTNVRQELKDSGFGRELIRANVSSMRKLVSSLAWRARASEWSDYTQNRSYTDPDLERKKAFVSEVADSGRWRLGWDLGCNTGEFSELIAPHCEHVVAMDFDHLAIERLYRRLREGNGPRNILPLVNNLANPSSGLGWRGAERKPLVVRGQPDLTLALALIHHIVLGANIRLEDFVAWLAEITQGSLVIEFVTRDDPMVKTLLLNKEDKFADYDLGFFERCLGRHFRIERRLELESRTRVLFHARKA